MQSNTLPGIVRIEIVRCSDIPAHAMLAAISGIPVGLDADSVPVKFFGTPSLKWNGTMTNGKIIEKSTLEFRTADVLPEGERIAFVVTAASGRQMLIGTREPKFPVVEYTETAGAPDGDAALRTYKITHIALKSVLPCVL